MNRIGLSRRPSSATDRQTDRETNNVTNTATETYTERQRSRNLWCLWSAVLLLLLQSWWRWCCNNPSHISTARSDDARLSQASEHPCRPAAAAIHRDSTEIDVYMSDQGSRRRHRRPYRGDHWWCAVLHGSNAVGDNILHRVSEKTYHFVHNLRQNINRFSKLFYRHILWKICNLVISKYPITPWLRRYTTLLIFGEDMDNDKVRRFFDTRSIIVLQHNTIQYSRPFSKCLLRETSRSADDSEVNVLYRIVQFWCDVTTGNVTSKVFSYW